jgi:hypothetical protein
MLTAYPEFSPANMQVKWNLVWERVLAFTELIC